MPKKNTLGRRGVVKGAALMAASFGFFATASRSASAAPAGNKVVLGRHLYFVTSNAVEGKEIEYDAFYAQHLIDIVKLPGFISAQRFAYHPTKGRTQPAFKYMVIYEIEGDPDQVVSQIGAATVAGKLGRPDPAVFAFDSSWVYSPV